MTFGQTFTCYDFLMQSDFFNSLLQPSCRCHVASWSIWCLQSLAVVVLRGSCFCHERSPVWFGGNMQWRQRALYMHWYHYWAWASLLVLLIDFSAGNWEQEPPPDPHQRKEQQKQKSRSVSLRWCRLPFMSVGFSKGIDSHLITHVWEEAVCEKVFLAVIVIWIKSLQDILDFHNDHSANYRKTGL
jgi:hypothetical protein